MRARCALVVLLAACASKPSPLDHAFVELKPDPAADPWAGTLSPRQGSDDDDKGFDLQGVLAKIRDSVARPGPFEPLEKSADYDPTKPHWGVLVLRGGIVERESYSFTGGHGTELSGLIRRMRELAGNDKLTGVVVRVAGIEISLPDAVELRAAFHDLRKAGKVIACHAENLSNAAYLVLAACDRIGLAPLGDLAITGPAAMPVHVKGLLDKLGIQADFVHVGAYKGAAEPLTRDAPSKEMEETLGAILDRRYQTMVEVIATDRKLAAPAVKALIDTGLFPADAARTARAGR